MYKIICMKSTCPVLGWCVCSGKCLVVQWHGVLLLMTHILCHQVSSVYSVHTHSYLEVTCIENSSEIFFSRGCQFKPRCFGFPKCCSQDFLRSDFCVLSNHVFQPFLFLETVLIYVLKKSCVVFFYCFVLYLF